MKARLHDLELAIAQAYGLPSRLSTSSRRAVDKWYNIQDITFEKDIRRAACGSLKFYLANG
jgi:hypothetical protein